MSPNSPSISPPSQAPDVSGSVLSWTSCQVVSSQRSLASNSSTSGRTAPDPAAPVRSPRTQLTVCRKSNCSARSVAPTMANVSL